MEILKVKELSKRFGDFPALEGVDLALEEGELLALVGPNGAGKTTLLRLISGELRPTRGEIYFLGRRIDRLPAWQRARLGIARTFQLISLFPELTVRENLQAAVWAGRWSPTSTSTSTTLARSHSLSRSRSCFTRQRVEELLELLGLEGKGDFRAKELSHGEGRLLELGLALAQEPRLLLLDEPTAGLSPPERAKLVELIGSLREQGLSVLLVEHDLGVVRELADRIVVLHQGRVLAEGPPERVHQDPHVQEVYLGPGGRAATLH